MSSTAAVLRPPAPTPHERPLGPLALLRTLRSNPLECWTKAHFEEPIVVGGFPFARVAVINDPAAVRRVLVEDRSTYQKAAIERRVLSAGMPNGLVTVDGEQWQRLRRTLAPLFGRTMTARFASAMARTAAALIERWQRLPDGDAVDIKSEMSRVALEGLVNCMFSEGLGDPQAVCAATTRYYETCGGIDPFDVIGLPDFVPRFKRRQKRPVLRAYYQSLSDAIAERRRSLAADPDEPRDILGAMLAAKDPETGLPMTEAEVKDNVMTFIFGGQETTSSAMTWAIYLLSQSPEWHERVAEEAHTVLDGSGGGPIECLVQTAQSLRKLSVFIRRSSPSRVSRCDGRSLWGRRSSGVRWSSSLPTRCIGTACCGASRICSTPRASCPAPRAQSIVALIFRLASGRVCAWARALPCGKRLWCWRR